MSRLSYSPKSISINVNTKGLKGDNETDDSAALSSLMTDVGSNNVDLIFDGKYKIGNDLTQPSNVRFVMANGAMFSGVIGTEILTLNGDILAGSNMVFDNIILAGDPKIKTMFPEWFGAHSTNEAEYSTFDSTPFIQKTLDFAGVFGGRKVSINRHFKCTTTLDVPAYTILTSCSSGTLNFSGAPNASNATINLQGAGAMVKGVNLNVVSGTYGRTIKHAANDTKSIKNTVRVSTSDLSTVHYGLFSSMLPVELTGVEMLGNDVKIENVIGGDGIQASGCPGIRIEGNKIHDIAHTVPNKLYWAIYVSELCSNMKIKNNVVQNCNSGGIHADDASHTNYLRGVEITGNTVDGVAYNGVGIGYCNGFILDRNVVNNCSQHVYIDSSVGGTISSNVLREGNATVIDSNRPMLSTTTSDKINIVANVFGEAGACLRGIYNNGCGLNISDNVFEDGRPSIAMNIAGGVSCSIQGNLIGRPAVAGQQNIAITGSNHLFARNILNFDVSDITSTGIRLSGGNNKCLDNIIQGGANDGIYTSDLTNYVKGNFISGVNRFPITGDGIIGINRGYFPSVLPEAAEGYRGEVVNIYGSAGVEDASYICKKKADNSYDWFRLDSVA
jgi:hypothetical protein